MDDYISSENELPSLIKEAKDIIEALSLIIESGDTYKETFEEIKKEISLSKRLNTVYSNDLKTTKDEIEVFILDYKSKVIDLESLVKKINPIQKEGEKKLVSIERLKEKAGEMKKMITEFKNESSTFLGNIKSFKEQSEIILNILQKDKKESMRITALLIDKEKKSIQSYEVLKSKYDELFTVKDSDQETKIEKLDSSIENIKTFNDDLNTSIKDNLIDKERKIDQIQKDIDKKRVEVDNLLSDTTLNSLGQGYLESMQNYSYASENKTSGETKIQKFGVFIFNYCFRYTSVIVNLLIFIAPLLLIAFLFFDSNITKGFLDLLVKNEIEVSVFEILLYKAGISVPLLWISWFGRKNIVERKRLYEEYNHKYRVVQMYLMFNTNNTYELSQQQEIEKVLIEVIKNNPAKYLGKDESFVDKLLFKIYKSDIYKEIKRDLSKEGSKTLEGLKNSARSEVLGKINN